MLIVVKFIKFNNKSKTSSCSFKLEDAIVKLTQLDYNILIRHNADELGYIHVIKENKTWVLHSLNELIAFAERLEG